MARDAAAELENLRPGTVNLGLEFVEVAAIIHDHVGEPGLLIDGELCREKSSRAVLKDPAGDRAVELLFGLAPHHHEHVIAVP